MEGLLSCLAVHCICLEAGNAASSAGSCLEPVAVAMMEPADAGEGKRG